MLNAHWDLFLKYYPLHTTEYATGFYLPDWLYSLRHRMYVGIPVFRASDISRKKRQNFAGFSGANSRKNRPISREKSQNWRNNRPISGDFRGRKVKIRRKISHFAGFWRKKVKFRRIFWGKFLGKSADFTGNFEGKLRQETISKKEPISLGFSLANFAKIDQFCVDVTSVGERFF